jgi:hypothetical protein
LVWKAKTLNESRCKERIHWCIFNFRCLWKFDHSVAWFFTSLQTHHCLPSCCPNCWHFLLGFYSWTIYSYPQDLCIDSSFGREVVIP